MAGLAMSAISLPRQLWLPRLVLQWCGAGLTADGHYQVAMMPTVRSLPSRSSSLASSSTQYSSSSVTVGVAALAMVTAPSGVGSAPAVAVVVILATAAGCTTGVAFHRLIFCVVAVPILVPVLVPVAISTASGILNSSVSVMLLFLLAAAASLMSTIGRSHLTLAWSVLPDLKSYGRP
jgi:hypothetical protein